MKLILSMILAGLSASSFALADTGTETMELRRQTISAVLTLTGTHERFGKMAEECSRVAESEGGSFYSLAQVYNYQTDNKKLTLAQCSYVICLSGAHWSPSARACQF